MTFEKQVLARIRTEKVKPTSRVYFKVRDMILSVLVIASVAALGLSFGMIIFMIHEADLALVEALNLSTLEKVVFSVPLFWIATSIIIALAAFINFKHTRKGYRLGGLRFVGIVVLISTLLGMLVYILNITGYINNVASENIPIYNVVVPLNTSTWFDPANGLLSGTVRERESDSTFTLRDREFVLWYVTAKNTVLPAGYEFHSGDRIRIIGTKTGVDTFEAIQIHPWAN